MDKQPIIDATKNPDYDPESRQKTVDRALYWAWAITLLVVLAFGFYTSHKLSQIATRLEQIDAATIRLRTINYSIARPRFEYRTVAPADTTFETEMNNYGYNGWEAVSARRAGSGRHFRYEIIMKKRY